jgi:hypothetical protein
MLTDSDRRYISTGGVKGTDHRGAVEAPAIIRIPMEKLAVVEEGDPAERSSGRRAHFEFIALKTFCYCIKIEPMQRVGGSAQGEEKAAAAGGDGELGVPIQILIRIRNRAARRENERAIVRHAVEINNLYGITRSLF